MGSCFGFFALMLGTLGCSSKDPGDTGQAEAQPPTWHEDVRPIVEGRCVGCHTEGAIGGFISLETFEEVSSLRTLVSASVESREMPPWKAVEGCHDYRDDISLTDEEIATVVAWVDAGAPEGDIELTRPGAPPNLGGLERVDLTLELPVPYLPNADVDDDYRCFPIQWPLEEEVFVTGYVINPGRADLVHHVIAFIGGESSGEALLAEEALDGKPGFECFGGPGPISQTETSWLGGWAPGAIQGPLPNNTGLPMSPGQWLVIQMHYNMDVATPAEDDTTIDIMVESTVESPAWVQPFTNPAWVIGGGMTIPANTDGVEHGFGYNLNADIMVHTSNLHMHNLGRTARMAVERSDGSEECLLAIDDWEFEWQRTYVLDEPVLIEEGERLSIECSWDNPTDRDLDWGDGTGDEMCLGSVLMSRP